MDNLSALSTLYPPLMTDAFHQPAESDRQYDDQQRFYDCGGNVTDALIETQPRDSQEGTDQNQRDPGRSMNPADKRIIDIDFRFLA
ncbi:MAG: hypothetical protein PVF59_03770, partial [Desulfobacterales bacterium]